MEEPESWAFPYQSEDMGEFLGARMDDSDALMFGRVTYEKFAAFWPTSDIEPFASKLNNSPKYVVSTTLREAPWGDHAPATVIRQDVREQILDLKRQDGKHIAILGSGALVRSLLKEGLIDELSLMVHPLVLGSGKRLFGGANKTNLRLADFRTFSSGVALMSYQPVTAS